MNISKEYIDAMRAGWLPGAMYPSEMVWLAEQIISHQVEILIECGRQDGVSTKFLGNMLAGHGVYIYSIDFDENKERLEKVKLLLDGLPVTCVSGDIHWNVPQLLKKCSGKRIAVVQDGPKGWEGLSTLLASALNSDVVMIAQHNLHKNHKSRAFFSLLACNPPFLENDDRATLANQLRLSECQDAAFEESNRPRDHSSLGICSLDGALRSAVLCNIDELDHMMGPWSAVNTAEQWSAGNYGHVSKLRKRQSVSWYRFKAR